MKLRKICFVGRDNYPVLNPSINSSRIGGESIQQTLLAKGFASSGYDVSMVVIDHGQPDGEVIEGITVIKTYRAEDGLPGFRFIHPRATSVFKALKRANADIYYQSCAGVLTGYVARHCKRHHRKFVFRVASDADCMPGKQLLEFWRDKKIYEYGLKRADLVLAQSQKQVSLLQKHYGLESLCMNMAVEIPAEGAVSKRDIDVLWVSNIRRLKRPEIVLEVASRLPNREFVMIGGPALDPQYFREIQGKAESVKNIRFLGAVPYKDMGRYFSTAKVFINTSEIEGFPNTFLQSWIHGVPVVSFFDPDGLIESKSLGFSPAGVDEMARIIDDLTSNDAKRSEMSGHVSSFALAQYSPESIVKEHIQMFEKIFE